MYLTSYTSVKQIDKQKRNKKEYYLIIDNLSLSKKNCLLLICITVVQERMVYPALASAQQWMMILKRKRIF